MFKNMIILILAVYLFLNKTGLKRLTFKRLYVYEVLNNDSVMFFHEDKIHVTTM